MNSIKSLIILNSFLIAKNLSKNIHPARKLKIQIMKKPKKCDEVFHKILGTLKNQRIFKQYS